MAKSMRPQVANGGARSPVSLRETRCRGSEAAALRLLARNPISNEAGYSEYLRILSAVTHGTLFGNLVQNISGYLSRTAILAPYTNSVVLRPGSMWLSALLFGARSTPGKQWTGKHRRVWKMTSTRRRNARDRAKLVSQVRSKVTRVSTRAPNDLLRGG